ncbi:MAG: hypothetical protein ABF264_01425 [Flavobacteriales bacterium]
MNISNDLKQLINASLVDNKISSKEKEILTKRAVSEGIDKDEFELYIDSLIFTNKNDSASSSEGILSRVIYHRKAGVRQEEVENGLIDDILGGGPKKFQEVPVNELKIRLWHVLFPGILIVSIILTGIFWPYAMSVDEALNVYDFEAARDASASSVCKDERILGFGDITCPKTVEMVKIITQEVIYMTDNNQFDKAAASIQELNALEFFDELSKAGKLQNNLNDTKDALYLTLLSKGINNKQLSEEKIKIYLSLMTDGEKKEIVKNLLK